MAQDSQQHIDPSIPDLCSTLLTMTRLRTATHHKTFIPISRVSLLSVTYNVARGIVRKVLRNSKLRHKSKTVALPKIDIGTSCEKLERWVGTK